MIILIIKAMTILQVLLCIVVVMSADYFSLLFSKIVTADTILGTSRNFISPS